MGGGNPTRVCRAYAAPTRFADGGSPSHTSKDRFCGRGSDGLEIVVVTGIGSLGFLPGAIPGHTRWGVSGGVVLGFASHGGEGKRTGPRLRLPDCMPSLTTLQGQGW